MLFRVLAIGAAAVVWAAPAVAQERGTVEFAGFASVASFDQELGLRHGFGGGGRIGLFLDPRWSMEFEKAEMRAKRPSGLQVVNVGILSSRLVFAPITSGRVSFLLGAGAGVSTETNFMHSYGVDGLVGAKLALTNNASLRVDGVWDWLANENWLQYKSIRVGVSLYRHPSRPQIQRVTVTTPAPPPIMMAPADSVSAAETRRLRERDLALQNLRDSLRNAPVAPSATTTAIMEARIHFAFDKSVLTDSATRILDEKVEVFRANPGMTITIRGYTDVKGTDKYNMALGERRAVAAKNYIVAHGISSDRIVLESEGERRQNPNTEGAAGQAPNRRAVFSLLITSDASVKR
jgi:peptidoglycan-associated lipoprotein